MDIEKIDPSEIPGWDKSNTGRHRQPETVVALELAVGEAIKFDCRWEHGTYGRGCGVSAHFSTVGTRSDKKFRTRCHERICYVERIA